jgi:hypothetical protein
MASPRRGTYTGGGFESRCGLTMKRHGIVVVFEGNDHGVVAKRYCDVLRLCSSFATLAFENRSPEILRCSALK